MPITAFYGGLLAFLYILLAMRVVGRRRSARIPLGDGDDAILRRRMRLQANFAEHVPFALLLMALFESVGGEQFFVHVMGGGLLFARILHAIGMSREPDIMFLRVLGTALTFIVMGIAAVLCLGAPFGR